MTTVFLRSATPPAADAITPQVPILAVLRARMFNRPLVLHLEPLMVDRQTYESAEKEMRTILEQRGFLSMACAEMPERNFLLMGVPVVCQE